MEVAEGHPFHTRLLQSSKKGRNLSFRIRDERDDGIDLELSRRQNLSPSGPWINFVALHLFVF